MDTNESPAGGTTPPADHHDHHLDDSPAAVYSLSESLARWGPTYTLAETASRLGKSTSTIRRMINRGSLAPHMVRTDTGTEYRIPRGDIDALVEEAAHVAAAAHPEAAGAPMTSAGSILDDEERVAGADPGLLAEVRRHVALLEDMLEDAREQRDLALESNERAERELRELLALAMRPARAALPAPVQGGDGTAEIEHSPGQELHYTESPAPQEEKKRSWIQRVAASILGLD